MKKIVLILLAVFIHGKSFAISNQDLKKQIDVLAEEIQGLKAQQGEGSFLSTNSIQNRVMGKTGNSVSLGSYGEFVYSDAESKLENGSANSNKNPVWDAQRWILYIGYDFSEKLKLFTEIEIEHANEIFIEQAFLNYQHSKALQFNVGVLLVPVGLTNLYHEPTTFLATQRSSLEKKIIPTTWRENGVSLTGEYKKLRYQFAMFNSLLGSGFTNDGVRGGRQKASKADASGLSFAQRTDYLLGRYGYVGASVYFGGLSGVASDVDQTLWDVHVDIRYKVLQLRALYTELSLSGVGALNAELGNLGSSSVAKKMNGYVLEVGYNILRGRSEQEIIPFFRYEFYDTQSKLAQGYTKDLSKERSNLTLGLNCKPLSTVVLKADYTIGKNKYDTGVNTWNLGVGWNF